MQKIVVLGTGGTIVGTAQHMSDNIGYTAAQMPIEELLAAVPGLEGVIHVHGELIAEQVAQLDSCNMDFDVWAALALRCAQSLADPGVRAIVITHGTDTIEETAWFLQSVLNACKPVVLTCAMRPATAIVPDGPQNILDAVGVAMCPGAQGVVVVAAGVIHAAQHVRKVHPYRVDAFSSADAGPVGWVEEGRVRLARNWPEPQPDKALRALESITNGRPWPWVEVISSCVGASSAGVDALVRGGVKGIVVAATGNGSIHHVLNEALVRAQAAGVQVVRSTRCMEGQILPKASDIFPDSGGLSPVKARIALMLDLMGHSFNRRCVAFCKG